MKCARLFRLSGIALVFLTLMFPLPGRGQFLLPTLLQAFSDAKKNAARYSENIRLSEALVREIVEDDETGIVRSGRPPGEGRTPSQRIYDLKEGIRGELSQAKTNQIAYTVAIQQLEVALDRYKKDPSPENLGKAQNIANQITTIRNNLDGNFASIKNKIRQISIIRSEADDKEWNNPNGRYRGERQILDNLWNLLTGTITPFSGGALQPGNWQETNLETHRTRIFKLSREGNTMNAAIGKKVFVGKVGQDPTSITFTHTLSSPEDADIYEGPIPKEVILQAIRRGPMTTVYRLERRSPTLLVGTINPGSFFIQWDPNTMQLKTFQRDPEQRVEWRALGK